MAPRASIAHGPVDPTLCRNEVLAEVFVATARSRPDHPALVGRDRTMTYAQVNAAADAIARGLVRRGIGPGDIVGLWMPRGSDLLVMQVAIAKAGAAWLPFDFATPAERMAACLADAHAKAVVVASSCREQIKGVACETWSAADLDDPSDDAPVDPCKRGLTPDHPAYLIYTSGSTGAPKGIVVTHRNICHYLRAANRVYGLRADDVVFQGASIAFDLAMEEIWIPYLVGATLWIADAETISDIDRLPDVLAQAGVTVLDTVPSLLATLSRDVPSLRVIILGGEVCPASVVARWSRRGRSIFNSYGPTETTIVATIAQVRSGEVVTIGRPIPNHSCYVVDEALELVPPGTTGELLIGGPGVSRGYVGRPGLTAAKFLRNPYREGGADPILYRSGDAVSLDEHGNLVFHGRIDDQVKIRGFRVELGEIEARLAELPGIANAAVVARQDGGTEHLVAFVVPDKGRRIDPATLRADLRRTLPSYMVPSHVEVTARLPHLPSGKVDRHALRTAPLAPVQRDGAKDAPLSDTEAALHAVWSGLFPNARIRASDDFFFDLGGHSLLAARLVSRLRGDARFRALSLRDVYRHRTIAAIARAVDAGAHDERRSPNAPAFHAIPRARFALCAAAQAVALLVIYGLSALPLVTPFITFAYVKAATGMALVAALAAAGAFAVLLPSIIALTIAAKWVVIGRFKAGSYPLWGVYYFRWWFVSRLLSVIPTQYLAGTPLQAMYFRLLGAHIGARVYLGKVGIAAPDLVEIGEHTSVGNNVVFHNCAIAEGLLKIGDVSVGRHCYIGTSAVLASGCRMEDYAELGDLSCLSGGATIATAEVWKGSPARPVDTVKMDRLVAPARVTRTTELIHAAIYAGCLMLFSACVVLPLLPVLALFAHWSERGVGFVDLFYVPAVALLYVVLTVLEILALRWLLLARVSEGIYSIHSAFYVRKWFIDQLMELSLHVLHPLYASVYLPVWYRMLGVRVGARAEIATAASITHDLLEIGQESFIADAAVLGDACVRHDRLILKHTRIGTRSFVGNSAVVPDGYAIPERCLLGVLSTPPTRERMTPGSTWFGTPCLLLPKRQSFDGHPSLTFHPPLSRVIARGTIEFARVVVFPGVIMLLALALITALAMVQASLGMVAALLLLPVLYVLVVGIPAALFTVALKWLVIGRYRPIEKPMWTPFVWRSEAVTSAYESLAVPLFLAMLRGTPFLAPWLRMLGSKVGRRVFLETTDLTEFDLIRIGDDAALNDECAVQTHLFEDRIMKTGAVDIGDRVVLGPHAITLYGSHLEDDSSLGPLSLAMKGERLPAGTSWMGSPARLIQAGQPEGRYRARAVASVG